MNLTEQQRKAMQEAFGKLCDAVNSAGCHLVSVATDCDTILVAVPDDYSIDSDGEGLSLNEIDHETLGEIEECGDMQGFVKE